MRQELLLFRQSTAFVHLSACFYSHNLTFSTLFSQIMNIPNIIHQYFSMYLHFCNILTKNRCLQGYGINKWTSSNELKSQPTLLTFHYILCLSKSYEVVTSERLLNQQIDYIPPHQYGNQPSSNLIMWQLPNLIWILVIITASILKSWRHEFIILRCDGSVIIILAITLPLLVKNWNIYHIYNSIS